MLETGQELWNREERERKERETERNKREREINEREIITVTKREEKFGGFFEGFDSKTTTRFLLQLDHADMRPVGQHNERRRKQINQHQ